MQELSAEVDMRPSSKSPAIEGKEVDEESIMELLKMADARSPDHLPGPYERGLTAERFRSICGADKE
jgi:hypothetical protein